MGQSSGSNASESNASESSDGATSRSYEQQLREIATRAATQATHETLQVVGFDVDNPKESQADFAAIRRIRKAKEAGGVAIVYTVAAMLATGVGKLVWDAIKTAGKSGGGG